MLPTDDDDNKNKVELEGMTTTTTLSPLPTPVVPKKKTHSHASHRISFRQELDNSNDEHPLHRRNNKNNGRVSFRDEYHAELSTPLDGEEDQDGGFADSNHDDHDNNDRKKKSDERRQRTKIGKADPLRDGGIVLAIFLAFYLIARAFSNLMSSGAADDGIMVEPLNKPSQMKQIKQALMELVQAQTRPHFDNPLRNNDIPCPVLLSPSRIPQAGWGLYAGQNYTIGQEIVRPASTVMSCQSTNRHHVIFILLPHTHTHHTTHISQSLYTR